MVSRYLYIYAFLIIIGCNNYSKKNMNKQNVKSFWRNKLYKLIDGYKKDKVNTIEIYIPDVIKEEIIKYYYDGKVPILLIKEISITYKTQILINEQKLIKTKCI